MMVSPPELTQAAFLTSLVAHFPSLASEVFDEEYEGLTHLQVSCLTRYANTYSATARLDELARVVLFFEATVERVDSNTENALYVSFLEHLDFEGETENASRARQLLSPHYRQVRQALRA
jgi:hypothetical protein